MSAVTTKPKLPQLTTPVSATFPSEISSAKTPLSAVPVFLKEEFPCSAGAKTPITPPVAYMDFLKAMSPVAPEKRPTPTSAAAPDTDSSSHDSLPSTASSEQTDCSCKCGSNHLKSPAAIPPSPLPNYPTSAPPTGATSFPSMHLPRSPALSTLDSPLSASTVRSPFSARSVRSPFDWEAALKARVAPECRATKSSQKSVRHIREVVTRTVTYTPRMSPAPKGKRRKPSDCSSSQVSSPGSTRSTPTS